LIPRGGRLIGRLPRLTVYSAAELVLLVLIAVQAARLIWVMVTPLGPVGDWKSATGQAPRADGAVLAAFDPFFRLSAGGPVVVTSLNLKLTGVREDRATGRGAAIIQLPDGRQLSFGVGEEIMAGVTLAAVGFDNVTINRGGAQEQIFIDQSTPAAVAGADGTAPVPPGPPQPQVAAPQAPANVAGAVNFMPRVSGGGVTGVTVTPGNDGGRAFSAAGFQAGDVIVQVNGQRVTSLEQARAAMGAGGNVNIMVERGGRAVPLQVRLN